jgi:hypothetical protein
MTSDIRGSFTFTASANQIIVIDRKGLCTLDKDRNAATPREWTQEDEARLERSRLAAVQEEREMAAAEGRPVASWARMED